jgi:hypothetical protein
MPKAATAKVKPSEKQELGYRVVSEIELMVPYLYNKHPDDRGTGQEKTEAQYEQEGYSKVHRNEDGYLIIPSWSLKVALLKGCKKAYKAKMDDLVKAFVFPKLPGASWGIKEPDSLHVCWGRIPPRTGPMNKIYRPQINAERKLKVEFNVTSNAVELAKLMIGWEQTGLIVGIGAWRPEYGRFRVLSFEKE